MRLRSLRIFLLAALVALWSGSRALAEGDIPLRDWSPPMYSLTGLGKTVDATPPRVFVGLPPCRVIDTRGGAPLGGGILANSEARNFMVTGICGIPAGAEAISANFTVTGSPSAPPGAFILAYPTGSPPSPIVSLLNFQAGQTIANAAIVPLSATGSLTVNTSHSTHVIMDVNGYFSDVLGTPGNVFELRNNSLGYTMYLQNLSTSCSGVCGLFQSVASTAGATAIYGTASAGSALNRGVWGNSNDGNDSAGVYGSTATVATDTTPHNAAGVRGTSRDGHGVLGASNAIGMRGILVDNAGNYLANGYVGLVGMVNYAFFAQSNYGGSGAKYFVEPHPEKPDTVIRYVSLEGPESGTYFRGRGKFERGMAMIEVPESFRLVTDAEGLSVQVTPIGEMASVAVVSLGLDRILVKGSRNVEFFYLVNGVRRSHKHLEPIGAGTEYRPERADEKMPAYLTEVQKEMLISNGTYKADGTVNMETARRLGWDKVWDKGKNATAATAVTPTKK